MGETKLWIANPVMINTDLEYIKLFTTKLIPYNKNVVIVWVIEVYLN